MDKIIIKDLRVTGIIGIYAQERINSQEMLINVIMNTDTRKAAETDDIADCVDYSQVAAKIKTHAQTSHRLTVEALANDIASLCLATAGVNSVIVKVEKTQAIDYTGSVGVEIERERVLL